MSVFEALSLMISFATLPKCENITLDEPIRRTLLWRIGDRGGSCFHISVSRRFDLEIQE